MRYGLVRSLIFHISDFLVVMMHAFVHAPKEKWNKLDNKEIQCIFTDCKNGMKGYKLWDSVTRKIVYSRDVIFMEVGSTSRNEEALMEKELEKLVFELRNKEHDLDELTKSYEEVELQTLVIRRSG